MAGQPDTVDAVFYAVIVPKWRTGHAVWSQDDKGRPILEGAQVDRIYQKKPTSKQAAGAVITRLTLRVDAEALLPLQPDVVINIKPGQAETIEVTAEAPGIEEDE